MVPHASMARRALVMVKKVGMASSSCGQASSSAANSGYMPPPTTDAAAPITTRTSAKEMRNSVNCRKRCSERRADTCGASPSGRGVGCTTSASRRVPTPTLAASRMVHPEAESVPPTMRWTTPSTGSGAGSQNSARLRSSPSCVGRRTKSFVRRKNREKILGRSATALTPKNVVTGGAGTRARGWNVNPTGPIVKPPTTKLSLFAQPPDAHGQLPTCPTQVKLP